MIWWLLLAACTLEVLSQTYGLKYGSKDISAIVYVLMGIAVGILPLLPQREEQILPQKEVFPFLRYFGLGLLAVGIFYFGGQAIRAQPLDYTFADMLPIIKVMGERWLAGDPVYAPIPEIWDGMQPIYLPLLWMTYVPALLLEVDIRIVNLLFILLASALAVRFWRKPTTTWHWGIYVPLLILLTYILITYTTFITITEEPVVVGFYVLLGYSVYRKHTGWIILALVGCLLSRYALVFWAATYLVYMFWQEDRRKALWIAGGAAGLGLVVMVWSEGIYELELFYGLKEAYLDSFQNLDLAWRTENTVSKNIGLARFVPFEYLIILHRAVFWGSLFLPILLYIWYHFRLRDSVMFGLFSLCSLKLCLVYFFNMNALPYSYLFYTSTFLSLIVLSAFYDEALCPDH
jgi:hypothetical protein